MGFVISYQLAAPVANDARETLSLLRQTSLRLEGSTVSPLFSTGPRWLDSHPSPAEVPATREVSIDLVPSDSFTFSIEVEAMEQTAFWMRPGAMCPNASFGLARYPATVYDPRSGFQVPTQIGDGWHWSASFSAAHALNLGVLHFLSCHLAVASLLERAAELGCLVAVTDETGFWHTRDIAALASLAAEWAGASSEFQPQLAQAMEPGGDIVHSGQTWDLAARLRAISSTTASAAG
jgi:hypothetical protein